MNWIPINTTLPTSPKIVILASLIKCKRRDAFLSDPSNQILTGFLAVTFIGVTMLFILKQIFG